MTNDEATALAVGAFEGKPGFQVYGPIKRDGQTVRHVGYTAGTAPLVRSFVSLVGDEINQDEIEAQIDQALICMGPPTPLSLLLRNRRQ